MIECPICHVNNEDSALFCAECGQRFGPPANQAPPPQPTITEPARSRPKLHSPILGGADADEPGESPDFGRLRGTGGRKAAPQEGSGKQRGGLRSPLLSGDDEEDFDEPAPRGARGGGKPAAKGGLRSPLLRGSDDEGDFDDDAPSPRGRSGGFPHMKKVRPQPADVEDDEPQENTGRKGGLRSPLLGGADEGDDAPYSRLRRGTQPGPYPGEERRSNPEAWDPGTGDRPKLRSKLLGGGGPSYDDDYDEDDEDYDDPNMLRSPLLRAAKRPDAEPDTREPRGREPGGRGQPPQPQQGGPQPFQGGPQPPQAPPLPQQGWNQGPQPAPPAGWNQGPQPGGWNEQGSQPNQPNQWNQSPIGGPGPGPMGQPIAGLGAPGQVPGWPNQSHTGNYGARPDPDPTPSKDFPAVKPPEPSPPPPPKPALEAPPEPVARPKQQVRSRLLAGGGDEEPDDAASSSYDRFPRGAAPAQPSVPVALMFGVVFALIGKAWYMVSFLPSFTNSVPMLIDQLGQIVVMIILIMMIVNLSKGSN